MQQEAKMKTLKGHVNDGAPAGRDLCRPDSCGCSYNAITRAFPVTFRG